MSLLESVLFGTSLFLLFFNIIIILFAKAEIDDALALKDFYKEELEKNQYNYPTPWIVKDEDKK